jgi:hypothetical protein
MFNDIRPYITKDEPFGPIDSGDIDSNDLKALLMLFEKHNWIYKNLRARPSIIIGRRGSGKTYYLRSVFFDKQYNFYVEIRTARVLGQVARVIQKMSAEVVFPEMVSELWETILWLGVLTEIRKHDVLPPDDLNVVNAYLEKMRVRPNDSVEDILWNVATMLEEILRQNSAAATDLLWGTNKITLDHAKNAVIKSLETSKKKFAILLDSLDDFQLDIDSVERSLQGLLKIVGSMNKPRDVVDIRFCLPSELYQRFLKLSSNPNKDFRRALKLQWTSSELILIGAQRLMFYLALHYPQFLKSIQPLDLTKRGDALTLIQAVLPGKITNQAGFQEETISYILRHTQLLPRHFLILLNSIFKNPGVTQRLTPFPVNEEMIVNGIRQMEEFIVGEIFVAFKLIHPTAEETCRRCLPELGHTFTMSDLHRVFTRHGKAVFGRDSLFEFQRMLLEIGALGKTIPGKETDLYIKGNFEYTISHQLSLSQEDVLCIHPLFSGIYRGTGKQERPVYPYGSALDDEDYRDGQEYT